MNPLPGPALRRVSLLAALAFLVPSAFGLATESGTVDELAAHLPAGILHWKSGHFSGGLANPPLGQQLVAAGPILLGTADHPLEDSPGHLLPARIPGLLLGLLTLLVTARLAERADGRDAAAFAIGAAALAPELLAHSRLATLDGPVTAFFTAATWLAWRAAREPSAVRVAAFAVAVGIAASMKFTALHLVPAITLGGLLLPGSPAGRLRRAMLLGGAAMVGVGAFAWITYGAGPARLGLPVAWGDGVLGKLGPGGHLAYLGGRRSDEGFAQWFLVAFAIKTPLPILVAAGLGALQLARRRFRGDATGFVAFCLLPAAWLLVALSLLHRVNIGLRHALPVLPALLVLAGIGAAGLWRGGGLRRAVAGCLALWLVVAVLRVTPHHLSYFNELAGGPSRGDRILIDSNLDWGQDEGALRTWIAGRDVVVNPPRPVPSGLVAVSVNARHGLLERDDLRRRWISRLPIEHRVGDTWTVRRVEEAALRGAASTDPVAALDYAWWLQGVGRPSEALPLLERNDLSGHDRHRAQWQRVRAEALLALDRPQEALPAARAAGDPDLLAAVSARLVPPDALTDAEALGAVTALARRGEDDPARKLAGERFGFDPFLPRPVPPGAPAWTEAARLRDLGRERDALAEVGRVLARHPADEDALWLYGELVVRRKTGVTEYPWPDVDWSGVGAER